MILPSSSPRRRERGVAVIVVLALLAILMLYVTANVRSLRIMSQEIKLVEQRQLRHWNATAITPPPAAATNASTVAEAGASN